jgi:hypothetical protein
MTIEAATDTRNPKLEGWTWMRNATKWHYFRGRRSLCRRWGLIVDPARGYSLENNDSPDNCKACARLVLAELEVKL